MPSDIEAIRDGLAASMAMLEKIGDVVRAQAVVTQRNAERLDQVSDGFTALAKGFDAVVGQLGLITEAITSINNRLMGGD